MVDLRILRQKGISADAWREKLEEKPQPAPLTSGPEMAPVAPSNPTSEDEKINKLKERVRQRCIHGRDWNCRNFRVYKAMDVVWDVPFRQQSPTLLRDIMDRYKEGDDLKETLTIYGFNLDEIYVDTGERDAKTGEPIRKLSVPVFYAVMVPLVRSYLTIRRSKLVNDRNLHPMRKYQPTVMSKENRIRAEVLTSRVDLMNEQYNHFESMNQSVFQMLLYGQCLKFTLEEWHFEEQERVTGEESQTVEAEPELKNAEGPLPQGQSSEAMEAEEERHEKVTEKKYTTEKYTVRAGLRYHHPHPSRVFWDTSHPIKSFNTDTGCTYGGFWKVMTYGELLRNSDFYNTGKISYGNASWWGSNSTFFNEVYNTATIRVAQAPSAPKDVAEDDRESWIHEHSYYGADDHDKSISVWEYREKLVPSEWGLGDYDYPVWARFVVAGDGTIVYAAPMGYRPIVAYKDNGDEKRRDDASLALQLTPFEDQLSNLLSQYLYSAKQNLANLTMIDTNVVEPGIIKKLKNLGQKMITGMNFIEFDSKKNRSTLLNNNTPQAFYSHRFPPMNTAEILQAMKTLIDLAERVLQYSSQEVAQPASHEQTKAEIQAIAASTTNILQYTGTAVDQGMEAEAIQIYEALLNYDEDEFLAEISSDHELTPIQLSDLGLTMDTDQIVDGKKVVVKAKKTALNVLNWAESAEARNRASDFEVAQAMGTFLRDIMANPIMSQAIGPKQAIEIANEVAKKAGIPLPSELRDMTEQTFQQQQALQGGGGGEGGSQQIVEQVMRMVKEGTVPIMTQLKSVTTALDALYERLGIAKPNTNGQPPAPENGDQLPQEAIRGQEEGGPPANAPVGAGAIAPEADLVPRG